MKKSEKLTQKRLKELLHYDPETGIFTWKVNRHRNKIKGKKAGYFYKEYLIIGIDRKQHLGHRLAWLYYYGYFPESDIDHINRNPSDNRICNLREVSPLCNRRNCGNPITNTSGVKGVSWNKECNKWSAVIYLNNKIKYVGRYKNFDEAVCHRLAAEQCLDWSGCDSNSPAYQYVQEMIKKLKKKKLPKIIV